MSGKHTAAGPEHPEPAAWTPENLHDAHELSQAALQWEDQRRTTAKDMAGRPRPSFDDAVHAHDEDGSAYILPRPLGAARIAGMVQAATLRLAPSKDELRTAVQAVTAEAARAVAQAHPDTAVEVEYALWGTPALRYDGAGQDQAALYAKGIPSDDLLERALASTPGGVIAAASIRTQRTAAAQAEPAGLDGETANTLPGHAPAAEPELTEAEIAQFRALAGSKLPHQPRKHPATKPHQRPCTGRRSPARSERRCRPRPRPLTPARGMSPPARKLHPRGTAHHKHPRNPA
jgi:hypothetical protein